MGVSFPRRRKSEDQELKDLDIAASVNLAFTDIELADLPPMHRQARIRQLMDELDGPMLYDALVVEHGDPEDSDG